jgi:single-strand DNA-binding protein
MPSRCLNRVMLIGNLTRDPELRYTPSGMAVASFGLATNRVWVTKQGERKEDAQFHRIVAWNKLAELCSQLLAKGRRIYVEGRIQYREITDQENNRKQVSEIVIDDMIILDNKGVGASNQNMDHQNMGGGEPMNEGSGDFADNGTIEDIVIPDEAVEEPKSEEPKKQEAPTADNGEDMPF